MPADYSRARVVTVMADVARTCRDLAHAAKGQGHEHDAAVYFWAAGVFATWHEDQWGFDDLVAAILILRGTRV